MLPGNPALALCCYRGAESTDGPVMSELGHDRTYSTDDTLIPAHDECNFIKVGVGSEYFQY